MNWNDAFTKASYLKMAEDWVQLCLWPMWSILLCPENDETERLIEKTIREIVPLKVTGEIKQARRGGGSLIFIGTYFSEHAQ